MNPIGVVKSHPRLFLAVAVAVAVGLLQPSAWRPITRFLIAWNVGAWLYLALAFLMACVASAGSLAKRASRQDEGRFALLTFGCCASLASIGAILAELATVKDIHGVDRYLHVGLSASTIVSAWLFIHMMFALHYANEFFMLDQSSKHRQGLTFPSTPDPDYFDFFYFAYTIGVASQTADVSVHSRAMRRTTLVHSILSFFFNTTILALTINIAAGLV